MESLAQRVSILRSRLDLTQQDLAAELGVSRNYVYMIESGRQKKASASLLLHLDRLERELSEGREKETASGASNRSKPEATRYKVSPAKLRQVPIISRAQAGQLVQWEELLSEEHELISTDCPDPKAVALKVEGDSMEPVYKAGDVIIVMPSFNAVNESLVVVRLSNGDVMFKEIVFLDSQFQRFRLQSFNPRYASRDVSIDEIEKMMPVYSVVRTVWNRDKWQAQKDAMAERENK